MSCNPLKGISGIYKIKSLLDDRFYVGSASDFYQRFKRHKFSLKKNKHENPRLQNFVNKYGLDKLSFEIVESCPRDMLVDREQYYLDSLNPSFNIYKMAYSPLGHAKSPETCAKLSQALKGRVFSEEHRRNIGIATRSRPNGMLGKKMPEDAKKRLSYLAKLRRHSPETKAKIGISLRGRPSPTKGTTLTEEHKEKLRIASTGRKHTEEAKQKISQANKGKKLSEEQHQKLSEIAKKRTFSAETKEKLRQARIGYKHSPETIEKLKAAMVRRKERGELLFGRQ